MHPMQVQVARHRGTEREENNRGTMIVEGKVIIELQSVEKVNPAPKKQWLPYLKLTDMKVGYLLNFGEERMKNGITRIIQGKL